MQDDNTANVVVSLTINGKNYNVTLRMVNANDKWVVDNITDPFNGDLMQYIKRSNTIGF